MAIVLKITEKLCTAVTADQNKIFSLQLLTIDLQCYIFNLRIEGCSQDGVCVNAGVCMEACHHGN